MFLLAWRSLRKRPGRFTGTLLAAFFGAAIIMIFNSLFDTATAPGVDDVSAETLSTSGAVVGGYGTVLVFFAIASTLTVNVRQREEEIELLRRTGATPRQLGRMVVGEAAVVALVAGALAIGPAMLGGRILLDMFKDSGQVAREVDYTFGTIAYSSGFGVLLLASVGASFLAVRRATRGQRGPRARLRVRGGALALIAGASAVSATFAFEATDPMLMAPAAQGAILLSIGLAAFSPGLLRALLAVVGRPFAALVGPSGYLAVLNLRRTATRLAGVLMPLVLFTGISTATLCMQVVDSDAFEAAGVTKTVEDKNLETLNLVVVGIIGVFACLMLINTLYANTAYRVREFGRQRLTGATPGQVLGMVGAEAALLTLTGVLLGTVAGLAGLVPYTLVRADEVLPDTAGWIWLGIAAVAAAATTVTALATARRRLRVPAVAAVAVAA